MGSLINYIYILLIKYKIMQTDKQITHQSTENLFNLLIERIPETSTGTYNKQDPTHYSKGSLYFTYKDHSMGLRYNNCTWGISLDLMGIRHRKETILGTLYLSYEGNGPSTIFVHKGMKNLLPLLFSISRQLDPLPEEEYFEDPMGCLADYE